MADQMYKPSRSIGFLGERQMLNDPASRRREASGFVIADEKVRRWTLVTPTRALTGRRSPMVDLFLPDALTKDRSDHFARKIREAVIAAGVAEREALMVQPHEVEHCGMQIVHVDFVVDRAKTKVIGSTVRHTAFDTTACKPHGEAPMVMVAPIAVFGGGGSTEFTTPDNECFVEQASVFEICEEGRHRLIDGAGKIARRSGVIVVGVPWLTVAVIDLREANPTFGKPSRQQASIGELARTVTSADGFGLPGYIEGVRRGCLHAERRLHGADASIELRIGPTLGLMLGIEALDEIDLPPLRLRGERRVAEIRNHPRGAEVGVIDVRALMFAWKETGGPEFRETDRPTRAKHNKPRQLGVFRAKPVRQPCPHAGASGRDRTIVHHEQRRPVIRIVAMHRTKYAEIVRVSRQVR